MFLATAFLLTTTAALTPDAPLRVITDDGIELRADEGVFVLYAALNAAGYSEETERRGPPLKAPVFHPLRVEVRDALRSQRESKALAKVRDVFSKNAAPLEVYLEAVLADDGDKLSKQAASLRPKLEAALSELRKEAALGPLFDKLADKQRAHAMGLKKNLEGSFGRAQKKLGQSDLRAPSTLVVVPNPLEAHGFEYEVKIGKQTFLVVGPGERSSEQSVLTEAFSSALGPAIDQAFKGGRAWQGSWQGLKTSRRISRRYKSGSNYMRQAVARALAHRVGSSAKASRDADEDFVDEQAKDGMRWARGALRLIDSHKGGSFAATLPKAASRKGP